jgi:hypothetical protein
MPWEEADQSARRETVLEMAQRHVRMAEARLARHKQLVREMELHGDVQLVEAGHVLLYIMETVVTEARRHVRQSEVPTENLIHANTEEIETDQARRLVSDRVDRTHADP